MERSINGIITNSIFLYLNSISNPRTLDFVLIENYYQLDDIKRILCLLGKFEPINLDYFVHYEKKI